MIILYIAPCSIHTTRWVNYFAERKHTVYLISHVFSDDLHPTIIKIHFFSIGRWLTNSFPVISKKKNLQKISHIDKTYYIDIKTRILRLFNPVLEFFIYFFVKLINIILIDKILHDLKPDIVHAHFVHYFGYYGLYCRPKVFFLSAWGSDIRVIPKRSQYHHFLTKRTLQLADRILCDANFFKKEIEKFGIDQNKISVIYYGTDVKKFRPDINITSIREKYNLIGSITIISTRNLNPIYDIETLIRAIPYVITKCPSIKILIVGTGQDEFKLKQLSIELKVSDVISFLGFIPNEQLPKLLAVADIYVSTSTSDAGLAASTAEAMACETAPVITDFGDNNIWVKHGINGFLFPIGDFDQLSSNLISLIQDSSLRELFGKKSREIIVEKNNYEIEMNKVEKLYQQEI